MNLKVAVFFRLLCYNGKDERTDEDMNIVTVTMNPCIDRTITIEKPIEIGGTHRVSATREEVSGKGINVSGLLKNWNIPTKCLGFDFRGSKLPVARALRDRGIPAWLHSVDGKLRCNIKVFDNTERTMTEFNEKGMEVRSEDIEAICLLIEKQLNEMDQDDLFVLTGSVPPGVPTDFYKQVIKRAREKGIRTVLDASGDLLKEGITAKPFALKPNKEELETILGHKIKSEEEICEVCKFLIEQGIDYICVTLGEKGAMLICQNGIYCANPLDIEVKGIQGAGDSVVAGMCVAISEGKEPKDILKYAMAAAAGSLILEGTQMCRWEDFKKLLPKVVIRSEKIGEI